MKFGEKGTASSADGNVHFFTVMENYYRNICLKKYDIPIDLAMSSRSSSRPGNKSICLHGYQKFRNDLERISLKPRFLERSQKDVYYSHVYSDKKLLETWEFPGGPVVKDLVLSLVWLGNYPMPWAWPKTILDGSMKRINFLKKEKNFQQPEYSDQENGSINHGTIIKWDIMGLLKGMSYIYIY